MFDRIGRSAEKMANAVSRRAFLGGFGRGALALAGAIGGILALPRAAYAAAKVKCCYYGAQFQQVACVRWNQACPPNPNLPLTYSSVRMGCSACQPGGVTCCTYTEPYNSIPQTACYDGLVQCPQEPGWSLFDQSYEANCSACPIFISPG